MLTCIDPSSGDPLPVLGPNLHDLPRRTSSGILFLDVLADDAGWPSYRLGRLSFNGMVRRFEITAEADVTGFLRLWRFEACPYDADRILVERADAPPLEAWEIDEANGRAAAVVPRGWPDSRLAAELRPVSWLPGSGPGNDSIAGFDRRTDRPVVYLPQRDTLLTDDEAPVPLSDAPGGRHRISLRRHGNGDEIRIDGAPLPTLSSGARLRDVRWSPNGGMVLLGYRSPAFADRLDYWVVELRPGASPAPRQFRPSPACLPILELDFLDDTRLVASAIDAASYQIFLFELTLAGHAVRRLTGPD